MKWLEKLDEPRRKYCKEEFALIIMFLLILTLFFSRPEVIGYASANNHNQNLDLTLARSQVFYLESIYPTPVHVTSLQMSGEVMGEGSVKVYLDNEKGSEVLVFSNLKREGSRINRITGTSFIGGSKLSGLSVTADTMPMKEEDPALEIIEGEQIDMFKPAEEGYVTVSGGFSGTCIESCLLQNGLFNQQSMKLIFYIEPGTTLKITELTYTTLEEI